MSDACIHGVWSTTALVLLLLCCIMAERNFSQSSVIPSSTCPSVCFCDETNYVNCVGDGLWDVPTTDIPRTVVRLELRNYAVGVLTMSNVQELIALVELKLQQTKIESIENGTFGNLTRLLRLDLSQNLMMTISGAMFEGLGNLRYLDLSTNRVTEMDEAFVDLVNLEQLNIRDNLLPSLSASTFTGLYKVQYLNLDSNRIASIEVGTFQYLTNLAHLIVSNNPLTALSRLDFFGSRLQYIDVSRVELTRIPQSLTRYVRDLRLAKNNLTQVRLGDFDSYPYLSLLVLDDNFLTDIESDALGRQEYLMRLWLNGNRLTQIPANLPPNLKVLYVEENLLKELTPYSFQGLFNLEQIFLQRNQIQRLAQCAFCDLISLHHLDLQANLLETIHEGAFANLSNLISLDLSQNPLKLLSDGCFNGLDLLKTLQLSRMKTQLLFEGTVFDPLKKLETLELYDSPSFTASLVNATRALQGLRNLRELNVMHNNLASLRPDFPHFFPQLKVAKLSGNHWRCDASILWLTDWVKKADTHFYHSYTILCSQPADLLYKPIMMLTIEDFVVNVTTKTTTTMTTSTVTPKRLTSTDPTTRTLTTVTSQIQAMLTNSHPSIPSTSMTTDNANHRVNGISTETVNVSTAAMESSNGTTTNNTTVTSNLTSTMTTPMRTIDFLATTVTSTATPVRFRSRPTLAVSLTVPTLRWTTQSKMKDANNAGISIGIPTSKATTEKYSENVSHSRTNATIESKAKNDDVTSEKRTNATAPPKERLIVIKDPNGVKSNANITMVIAMLFASGLALLLASLAIAMLVLRCRKGKSATASSLNCQMRRSSSSISYSPQRDEVSIVSVSEGTVGLHTLTHQGLSNKLYFVLENGTDSSTSSREVTKDALPDPSLRELLPESTNCYPTMRHERLSAKKFRSYCFDK